MSHSRSIFAVAFLALMATACTSTEDPDDTEDTDDTDDTDEESALVQEFQGTEFYGDGYDEIVYIDTTADLQAHIGDTNTLLVLETIATDTGGAYVIPACATREEERTNPACGQMTLGEGSALIGALVPEIQDGMPTGQFSRTGPVIDCAALSNEPSSCDTDDEGNVQGCVWDEGDYNGWELACLEVNEGTVWGVTIDNGTADPQPSGQGNRRNALLARGNGGTTTVARSHLSGARRGIFQAAVSNQSTGLVVRETVVTDTELAALFTLVSDVPPAPVDNVTANVDVESLYADDIGRVAVIFGWTAGGDNNHTTGRFTQLDVAWATVGFAIFAEGFLTTSAVTNSSAELELSSSRFAAEFVGLFAFNFGVDASLVPFDSHVKNSVVADIRDVEIRDSLTAIALEHDPWPASNQTILGIADSSYVCEREACASPGEVWACQWEFDAEADPSDAWSCGDPYPEPLIQLAGTAEDFASSNTGFDISGVLDLFNGESLPE